MRGFSITSTLVVAALLAEPVSSMAGGLKVARPWVSAAPSAKPGSAGAVGAGMELPPRWREIQEARAQRWRSFPDLVVHPSRQWEPHFRNRRGVASALASVREARPSSGSARTLGAAPTVIKVALIRIDFQNDRSNGASTGDGRFDLSDPGSSVPAIDRPPHNRRFFQDHMEALRRYYVAQSYGTVEIQADVWPREENLAYTVSDMADFGPWAFGNSIYPAAVHMLHTFLEAADAQAKALVDTIPWREYDGLLIVHAGSDFQSDVRQDSPNDIPTFALGVADSDRVIFPDSLEYCDPSPTDSLAQFCPIGNALFVPETANQDEFYGTINSLIAHECGHHLFGLADLYDIDNGLPVVGFWSLMDTGNLAGATLEQPGGGEIFAVGLLPPSIDPFQRFFVGNTLQFPQVDYDGQPIQILDSERHPDMRSVTLTSDEFLILENRSIAPYDSLELDQADSSRVILGPKTPDPYEYDSLLPGWPRGHPYEHKKPSGGILVWHIDASVLTFHNSLRANEGFGFNTNPRRLGISVIEADGLKDLGDLGSPLLFGSYRDPWYASNTAVLSDTTVPNLIPHVGTRPHIRLEFPDPLPDDTMHVQAVRAWQLPGWPVEASFPPGGPQLLAVDADGAVDGDLELCWAGGDTNTVDANALFVIRRDGQGLFGSSALATLPNRPRPVMAALPRGGGLRGDEGPSLFAASTYLAADASGGQVWLIDSDPNNAGQPVGGWPPTLPSPVTTPPVIVGDYPNAYVLVGCENGNVYVLALDGTIHSRSSQSLAGGIRGRLAVAQSSAIPDGAGGTLSGWMVAAGSAAGDVAVWILDASAAPGVNMATVTGWPRSLVQYANFAPDFLWLDFDGAGAAAGNPTGCRAGLPELVAHDRNHLWAFCAEGRLLPGWGRDQGDTLVAALGAGDPDGDGYPEVLTQTPTSRVAFVNLSGYPSPGWPKAGSPEGVLHENPELTFPAKPQSFPTQSPPLALDLDGDLRSEVVAPNTSGLLAALDAAGRTPSGWPLATGAGAGGSAVAADLDHDGFLEVVAPDRGPIFLEGEGIIQPGLLFGYTLPVAATPATAHPWRMLGGDPGRTASLPASRLAITPAATPGPLVRGSLKAFPNPARKRPVSFAYQLSEPADVEFRILDASGHEVASFSRSGRRADNLEIWEPGDLPAGLYLARLRFRSSGRDQVQVVPLGLLR